MKNIKRFSFINQLQNYNLQNNRFKLIRLFYKASMNQYLTHVFQQFTLKSSSKQFNAFIKQELLELKPVDLTKIYKQFTSSTSLFNQLNLLLAKGAIKYSPANCTVQLSLPSIMLYQRMFKMVQFAKYELDPNVGQFVKEWLEQAVQNGMGYPIMFEKKKLQKVFSWGQIEEPIGQTQQIKKKPKGKGKQQTQISEQKQKQQALQYNYHKLIYEYKSERNCNITQTSQQPVKNDFEVQKQKNLKSTNKPLKQSAQQSQNKIQSYNAYMLNVEQLTKLIQLHRFVMLINGPLRPQQKQLELFEFINSKDRQRLMQQVKYRKLEEFIAQVLSPDSLLIFNLVRKYPFITEKQLIKLTMLEVLQTRASLNKLLEKGFLYFYYENARTIVYKVIENQILQKKYLDTVAQSIINLTLGGQKVSELGGLSMGHEKVKNKLIEFQCQIQRLDDIMILFGY